jgi:hypothetical protein
MTSVVDMRGGLRWPPTTGKILRGTTAGAAAALFDLQTLYYGAGTFSAAERTWLIFRVWSTVSNAPQPDCFYEFSNVNTVVATAAASWPMASGEAQEFYANITGGHRYLSLIRAGSADVLWSAYLSDHRYA